MNLEEQNEQNPFDIKGLGEAENGNSAKIPVIKDSESYFGKPDFYDYSEVELPENYCYDENLLNEFNELASKYNLSQKGANELMSLAVKHTQQLNNYFNQAIAEQTRQQIDSYKQMLNSDKEIGGTRLSNVINTANIAYSEFADAEVKKILDDTGLNCHPKFVKMFYNIGKRMSNDLVYGINSPAILKENREDILFPTM